MRHCKESSPHPIPSTPLDSASLILSLLTRMVSGFGQLLILVSFTLQMMMTLSEVSHQKREHSSAAAEQLSTSLYIAYGDGLQQKCPDIVNGSWTQWLDSNLVNSGRNAIAPHYRQIQHRGLLFDISYNTTAVIVYNMSDGSRFTLQVSFQPKMLGIHDIGSSYVSLYVIGFVDPCHNTWKLIMQSFSDGHCSDDKMKWCAYSHDWESDTGLPCHDSIPSATFARLGTTAVVFIDTLRETQYLVYFELRPGAEAEYIDIGVSHSEARFYWNQASLEVTVQVKANGKYYMYKIDGQGSVSPVPSKNIDCPMWNPWLFNCTAFPVFLNSSDSSIPLIGAVGEPKQFTAPGVGSSVAYIQKKVQDDGYEVRVCRPDLHGGCQVLSLSEKVCDVFSVDAINVISDGLEVIVTVCGGDQKAFFEVYIFTEGRYMTIKSLKLLRKIGGSVVQMLSFGRPFISTVHLPEMNNPYTDSLSTLLLSTIIPVVSVVCVLFHIGFCIAFVVYKIKTKRSYHKVGKDDDVKEQLVMADEYEQQEVKCGTRSSQSGQTEATDGTAEDPDCVGNRPDISNFSEGVIVASHPSSEPIVVTVEIHEPSLPSPQDRQEPMPDNASSVHTQSVPTETVEALTEDERRLQEAVSIGDDRHPELATLGSHTLKQPPNIMRREPIGNVAEQAPTQPSLTTQPPVDEEETEHDVPVAQEEARHNEASTMVVNTNLNRPPLTDRKEWPAGDGR